MRHLLILLTLLLGLGGTRPAQADTMEGGRQTCASELSTLDLEFYQRNLAAGVYEYDAARTQATYLVYLAFHVVRTTSGTGGIAQSQLDQAMVDLATAFAGTGICFHVLLQDTINSSTYYNIDSDAERSALKAINNHPNAIDCYFVNDDDGWCGMSSFTWSPDQGITFSNSCVGLASNPSTFPHEVGHYFDLLHTHETANGSECPNGSNCGTAGDGLCDTPADPGLGTGNVNASCTYTGNSTIFCAGQTRTYSPSTINLMSYSRKTCRTQFTANQRTRMLATLTGPRWGEVGFNAPDFDAPTPAGWSNSIVPRNTTGASNASCLVTSTLPGNSNGTWLNAATRQANSNAIFPFIHNRLYLDDVHFWNYNYGWGTNWVGTLYYTNFGPITVRGGRHALTARLDRDDEVCETNENDNVDHSQWVWSPYQLAAGASVSRSAPPARMTSTFTYPNCDGFQFTGSSWWTAIAIQPVSSTADYDINLHQGYANSTTGFAATLASSAYGSGLPDWVLINHNNAGYGGSYEAGVTNYNNQSGNVRVNRVNSRTVSQVDGTRVCGELAANQILDIFEFYIAADELNLSWRMDLSSEQSADLDLYLYDRTVEYAGRSSHLAVSSNNGTPSETITQTFTTAGYYALVVAKRGSADLGTACAYDLTFSVSAFRLGIYPPTTPQVAVVQDTNPWGSTEWTDQLTAAGIAYDVITTASLAATNLVTYSLIIVPSPTSNGSYLNIRDNLERLDDWNLSGGVLIMATGPNNSSGSGHSIVSGINQTWETCATAHPTSHILVTGVGADAPGNNAVHYVYSNVPAGWTTLATTDCGTGSPCMLTNESRGLVLYGAPMEHSELYFNCSLGESIENLVAWGWKRARQTVRGYGTPNGSSAVRQLVYRNGSLFGSASHSTSEALSWLSMSPTSGNLSGLGTVTTNWTFNPSGLSAGTYRGTATVTTSLYNSPETVHAVFTVGSRKPVAPLVVSLTPVDFSTGNATLQLTFNPVTQDINGNPITVEHYNLYYNDNAYLDSPGVAPTNLTSLLLYFGNVGMLEQGFVRVTAVDENGLLVADSHPGLPLPDASTLDVAPESFLRPLPLEAVDESTR
jgi:hypothetical protein